MNELILSPLTRCVLWIDLALLVLVILAAWRAGKHNQNKKQ